MRYFEDQKFTMAVAVNNIIKGVYDIKMLSLSI